MTDLKDRARRRGTASIYAGTEPRRGELTAHEPNEDQTPTLHAAEADDEAATQGPREQTRRRDELSDAARRAVDDLQRHRERRVRKKATLRSQSQGSPSQPLVGRLRSRCETLATMGRDYSQARAYAEACNPRCPHWHQK